MWPSATRITKPSHWLTDFLHAKPSEFVYCRKYERFTQTCNIKKQICSLVQNADPAEKTTRFLDSAHRNDRDPVKKLQEYMWCCPALISRRSLNLRQVLLGIFLLFCPGCSILPRCGTLMPPNRRVLPSRRTKVAS